MNVCTATPILTYLSKIFFSGRWRFLLIPIFSKGLLRLSRDVNKSTVKPDLRIPKDSTAESDL